MTIMELTAISERMERAAFKMREEADAAHEIVVQLRKLLGGTEAGWRRPPKAAAIIQRIAEEDELLPRIVICRSNKDDRVVQCRRRIIVELLASGYTATDVGKMLGGMHHSTVLYHAGRTKKWRPTNESDAVPTRRRPFAANSVPGGAPGGPGSTNDARGTGNG